MRPAVHYHYVSGARAALLLLETEEWGGTTYSCPNYLSYSSPDQVLAQLSDIAVALDPPLARNPAPKPYLAQPEAKPPHNVKHSPSPQIRSDQPQPHTQPQPRPKRQPQAWQTMPMTVRTQLRFVCIPSFSPHPHHSVHTCPTCHQPKMQKNPTIRRVGNRTTAMPRTNVCGCWYAEVSGAGFLQDVGWASDPGEYFRSPSPEQESVCVLVVPLRGQHGIGVGGQGSPALPPIWFRSTSY